MEDRRVAGGSILVAASRARPTGKCGSAQVDLPGDPGMFLRFTLGISSQRSSTLSYGTEEVIEWPSSEVVTLATWHHPVQGLKVHIEIIGDNNPCLDELVGTGDFDVSNVASTWQLQSIMLRGANYTAEINLSFWIVVTTESAPVPPKLYSKHLFSREHREPAHTGKSYDSKPLSQRGFELKVFRIVATSLPETEYWGSSCGNKQDPFCVIYLSGRSARTSTQNGKGTDCEWSGEVLELFIDYLQGLAMIDGMKKTNIDAPRALASRRGAAASASPDADLIVQVWNDNSPARDVLIGEARTSLDICLGNLETEHTVELNLARPSSKRGLPRPQGSVCFSIVANLAREFFAEEIDCRIGPEINDVHLTAPNELRVAIIQARNLPAMDRNFLGQLSTSDPLVTVSCAGRRLSSSVKHKSLFPVWNEILPLRVCPQNAVDTTPLQLEVTVDDWDDLTGNDFIGRVDIPLTLLRDGKTRRHWHALRDRPRLPASAESILEGPSSGLPGIPRSLENHGTRSTPRGEIELALQWRH